MVVRGVRPPNKLRADAIAEAIFEIRFETPTLPERFIGRMMDKEPWKSQEQRYLPAHQMPPSMRQLEPIKYQPTIEVGFTGDEPRGLRAGPYAVSYHRARKYVGWNKFRPELEETIDNLFSSAETVRVTRLGLRYLNALNKQQHGIGSVADLDLRVSVAGGPLADNFNLNYLVHLGEVGQCVVKIATREFIQGPLPEGTSAYIDVDVSTTAGFECTTAIIVKEWIVKAHESEKCEFFHLLNQSTIDALKES